MRVIPDNTGTIDQQLEYWAVQHMARDVWMEVQSRHDLCRTCRHYRPVSGQHVLIQCDQKTLSLAGDRCPLHRW